MTSLPPAVRTLLVFLSMVVAALAAAPPTDLPGWAAAVLAALAAGFAGLGLVPPSLGREVTSAAGDRRVFTRFRD